MEITLKAVNSRRELRRYINLPSRIHAGHRNWMPPLYMDERAYYDPLKNKAFTYCDTILLLAYRGEQPVGRAMGIINHLYNDQHQEKTARFEHLDCYEEEEVAHALLEAIEQWAREKGMEEIVGPFGFSEKDPEGFMVEGFDKLPILVTACNLPYMPRFMESKGYEKKLDCLDFLIDIENKVPDIYPLAFERAQRNKQFRLLEFRKTKELKPYITGVFQLVNRTYEGLYGFLPLDDDEIRETAARYLPLLDPRFVKVILGPDGQAAAFIVGIPNMTKGIQRSGGRLLPFGIFHILRAARATRQLDLMLGAIDEQYRGRGLDVLMGWAMIQSARKAGIHTFETHLVLETNTRMLAEYERMGATLHKRFRIYRKSLL
ncbi:MAG: hypothetical protein KDC66_02365 [Phaeodactylibacter sp.]|nr:hypothetical protein [Phaeodactylibacter sp.]